ncbi:MAG TPA: WYL domain-containing protein [Bacteroidales bacterium]|nr:WYL domain-containing protein [Bacteroidales bacterium]
MFNILDFILDNTARQRYALVKLFMDRPFRKFTRLEILEMMNEEPYLDILTKGGSTGEDNPFINKVNHKIVPTILRDRLDELVKEKFIVLEKTGNKVFYHLKENTLTNVFEDYEFSEKNIAEIRTWIGSFAKYKELPFAGLLEMLDKRSRATYKISDDKEESVTIVDFETPFRKDADFSERVTGLYWDIHDRQVIKKLTYLGNFYSGKKPETITVEDFMPYVLKESRGQWYVTGKCPGDNDFRSLPVNRIIDKQHYEDEREFVREPFSPEEFWDGCAGITRYSSPLNISFRVKNGDVYNNIDYIRILPIVKGHQENSMEGDWMKVMLGKVYMGPELVRIIRSFGRDNIKDVTPRWLEEDLWEAGHRDDFRFSIYFDIGDDIEQWKSSAEKKLHMKKGGENSASNILIMKSPNKPGWYQITLNNVLINSVLYYFTDRLLKDFSSRRVRIKNQSFLR